MQSQPILMITMAIVVAIHGTTLATLNQMMEQVSYFSVFGIFGMVLWIQKSGFA